MYNAMEYAIENTIEQEADYPYTAVNGKCVYASSKGVVQGKTRTELKANSAADLQAAIAQGPVSVSIEADKAVFQFYKSGIFTSTACGTTLDHGVLAVGYGTENGLDFYIVKNSWGASWGEAGYIRIANNDKTGAGVCGIQMDSSQPTTN